MVKILVVDDEANITDSLVGILRSLGYNTIGAKNSKDAFEALKKYKPDILLLDINLREKVNGFDILREGLKSNPNIQVAILTGGDYKIEECLKHGAKALLQKPLSVDKVIDKIKRFIEELQMRKTMLTDGE